MANANPTDPFGMWRDLIAQWENSVNALGNQAMGSDDFGRSMSQVSSLSLAMQQMMSDMMGRAQAAANLPTRTDIVGLSERLRVIEETLNRVAAVVDRLAETDHAQRAAAGRPPRTRKPPGGAAPPEGEQPRE
ncbi:MAG: hypothetical protein ACREVG_15620 [Burkholderiales bacterium]